MIPWVGGVIPDDAFFSIMLQGIEISVVIFALNGLYPGFGRTAVEEIQQIFYSLTLSYGVLALAIFFQQVSSKSPAGPFLWVGCSVASLNMIFRFAARNRFSLFDWWGTPVLVVGPVERARDVIRKLTNSRRMGLRPVLIFDEGCPSGVTHIQQIPVVMRYDHRGRAGCKKLSIHYAVFVGQDIQDPILRWLGERFASVLVVLDFSPLGSLWVQNHGS